VKKRSCGVLVLLQSIVLKFECSAYMFSVPLCAILGTLRYEDGKARMGTAVDAGNFRESRHHAAKDKMLKMCIFV